MGERVIFSDSVQSVNPIKNRRIGVLPMFDYTPTNESIEEQSLISESLLVMSVRSSIVIRSTL